MKTLLTLILALTGIAFTATQSLEVIALDSTSQNAVIARIVALNGDMATITDSQDFEIELHSFDLEDAIYKAVQEGFTWADEPYLELGRWFAFHFDELGYLSMITQLKL